MLKNHKPHLRVLCKTKSIFFLCLLIFLCSCQNKEPEQKLIDFLEDGQKTISTYFEHPDGYLAYLKSFQEGFEQTVETWNELAQTLNSKYENMTSQEKQAYLKLWQPRIQKAGDNLSQNEEALREKHYDLSPEKRKSIYVLENILDNKMSQTKRLLLKAPFFKPNV